MDARLRGTWFCNVDQRPCTPNTFLNWKHDVPDDNVMGGTFKKEHLKSIKIIPCPVQLQEYDDCPPQRAPSEPCTAMDFPAPAVGTR